MSAKQSSAPETIEVYFGRDAVSYRAPHIPPQRSASPMIMAPPLRSLPLPRAPEWFVREWSAE
ncbi:MAG TPA: hypothetical protein VFT88_05120 [Acidobacteriaceae bacterium]|jgi:hypothetical protein|nr:hypothetical protein [Acidobacteriaceae bacterium]